MEIESISSGSLQQENPINIGNFVVSGKAQKNQGTLGTFPKIYADLIYLYVHYQQYSKLFYRAYTNFDDFKQFLFKQQHTNIHY